MSAAQPPYLLIVEDDKGIIEQLKWALDGYQIITAENRTQALAQVKRYDPVCMTLDLGLPPDPQGTKEGLLTLKAVLDLKPEMKVIMVTGQSDNKVAIEAIGLGAYDFYTKPIDPTELNLIISRAFYLSALEIEKQHLLQTMQQSPVKGIITGHCDMLKICRTIEKISPTDITTLLRGESGTGKEVLARALHSLSHRKDEKFVAVNCAAIPDTLLESELFGHEKGAFTGANRQVIGKLELAQGGTFFLDEIGDLPMALQPKLLRFLQERVIERLGGRQEIALDIRVVCATHQNLIDLVEAGQFREDLYYRINEMTIEIPPLRDRQTDIILLSKMLFSKYLKRTASKATGFSTQALEAISSYHWPGNVRELENRIKRAMIMSESKLITLEDLALPLKEVYRKPFSLKLAREEAETEVITNALIHCENNCSKTAELLGVTRPTLYHLMEKLKIRQYKKQSVSL